MEKIHPPFQNPGSAPACYHFITSMQPSFLPFLSTWPIQFHLLLRISSLIFFTPVTWEIVSFRMNCGYRILRIRLSHVNWNPSSFFSSAAINFHASHPYNRTGRTKVLNRLIFVFRPMLLVFQIFFRLKNAPRTLLRRFLISSVPPPSFVTVAPRAIQTLRRLRLPLFRSLNYFVFSSCIHSHHFAFLNIQFQPHSFCIIY